MRWFFLGLLFLIPSLAYSTLLKNHVIAVVAGEAITARSMEIESIVEQVSRFNLTISPTMTDEDRDRLLQQLIIRTMVVEENRVLRFYRIPKGDIDKKFSAFRSKLGEASYKAFVRRYGLSETDVRKRLSAVLLLEKTLSDQEDIETWLKQLRSRHSVLVFKN